MLQQKNSQNIHKCTRKHTKIKLKIIKHPLCQLWFVFSFKNKSNRKWESSSEDEMVCSENL